MLGEAPGRRNIVLSQSDELNATHRRLKLYRRRASDTSSYGFSGARFSTHPLTLGSIQLNKRTPGNTPKAIASTANGSKHTASRGVNSGKCFVSGFVPRYTRCHVQSK